MYAGAACPLTNHAGHDTQAVGPGAQRFAHVCHTQPASLPSVNSGAVQSEALEQEQAECVAAQVITMSLRFQQQ